MRRASSRNFIKGFTAALASSMIVAGAAVADEPIVLVRVRVDPAYSNAPASLAALNSALAVAPLRVIPKDASKPPQQAIVDVVKFGPHKNKTAATAYKRIESRVRSVNPEAFQTERSADLLVPDLPPWAYTKWNHDKAINYVPKIASWSVGQAKLVDGRLILSGDPTLLTSGLDASQRAIREYHLPLSVALAYLKSLSDKGLGATATLHDRPFTIKLAATECVTGQQEPQPLLSADQRQRVMKALQRAVPQREVFVLIADTGYPTEQDYKQSRQFVVNALGILMAKFHFGPLSPDILAETDQFSCPGHPHVVQIAQALREFEALDAQHVKVVYVPLTTAQNSTKLLKALLRFNYFYRTFKDAINKPIAPPVLPTPEQMAHADAESQRIIAELPDQWPSFRPEVQTDKSVLDAWLLLMQLYAAERKTTFFFSTSWTMTHEEPSVDVPSPLRGAVVAATGNGNEDIGGPVAIDFAQRSVGGTDTLAVMNLTGAGKQDCKSGLIREKYWPRAFAVGLSGRLYGSLPDCTGSATSYAAPRVAWLLAAAEAIRTTPYVNYGPDQSIYLDELRSGIGLQRFVLDPVTFLERMP